MSGFRFSTIDDGQRAMSAARYSVAKEEESKARSLANLKVGEEAQSPMSPIGDIGDKGRSRDDAADKFKTSSRTVDRATTVLKKGSDELVKAVEKADNHHWSSTKLRHTPNETTKTVGY